MENEKPVQSCHFKRQLLAKAQPEHCRANQPLLYGGVNYNGLPESGVEESRGFLPMLCVSGFRAEDAFGQGVVKRAFAAAGADDGYLELAYPVPTWTRQRASSI